MTADCSFCQIITGALGVPTVFQDAISWAFLDYRPLFPGHTLLVPRLHVETLTDLPQELVAPLFSNLRLLTRAVELGCDSDGSFVAMNNRVSQSVPHLHIHIVPRRKKDGLKGFFWPRQKYGAGEPEETAQRIRHALAGMVQSQE
ncbi:histidine triad (HIT) family hydrolase [Geotalea daltonii FRC-32]|uniref:Histidine triad (HIT) family hydrolase n=1 Tax=Geotalea daltonii (strain DSM 22248 / JCM 15807 / FRC-32) TaxID=316067 RepID=B9M9L3_GEODF|nr:histidine triad (HIT) family hydrolase [Geotalea daltonii FRC-32]